MPPEAQFAPAFAIAVADYDGDGSRTVLKPKLFAEGPETSRVRCGARAVAKGMAMAACAPSRVRRSVLRLGNPETARKPPWPSPFSHRPRAPHSHLRSRVPPQRSFGLRTSPRTIPIVISDCDGESGANCASGGIRRGSNLSARLRKTIDSRQFASR